MAHKHKPLARAINEIVQNWRHQDRIRRMQQVIREGMAKMRVEQIEAKAVARATAEADNVSE